MDLNEKLNEQVEKWRNRLLDIGNRNPLINTSFHATRGVLEFAHPDPEVIWQALVVAGESGNRAMRFPWKRDLVPPPAPGHSEDVEEDPPFDLLTLPESAKDWSPPTDECLASSRLRSGDLVTFLGDRALERRLRTLNGYAELSLSEQGVHCLFLAFGFIKWYESPNSSTVIRSPLMLVPASLTRVSTDSPWSLVEAEDDVIDNLCLRHRFKQDFGLELPELPELDRLEEEGAMHEYLLEVQAAIEGNERWEVEDRCCLGRFAFPKVAMWQDLGDHLTSIGAHGICQVIAGQNTDAPGHVFGDVSSMPDGQKLDEEIDPGELKAILNCDSSQLEAIVAARRGISFVLDGPPGTGKSQTIANIIADALSQGKRVLFVSEKVSALEVVKRRLDDCGLGDFCLECHSSKANRKAVLEELRWCLEIPAEVYPDITPKLSELKLLRQTLNDYVRALHKPQQPLGISMFELNGNIARLNRLGMTGKSRIRFTEPESITAKGLATWIQLLNLAKEHQAVLSELDSHPWRGCQLVTQTLSLKEDIGQYFSELADGAETLERLLASLIEADLVASKISFFELNSVVDRLLESLTVPPIPDAWFASPREVAETLVKRQQTSSDLMANLAKLPEYVDNIIAVFPDEIASLTDMRSSPWLTRLSKQLPSSYADCSQSLFDYAGVLHRLAGQLGDLEVSRKLLVDELNLPVKLDLPISAIPKLILAAQLIAQHSPLISGWFDTEIATAVKSAAEQANVSIDKIDALQEPLNGRISSQQLLELASKVPPADVLRDYWELVNAATPTVATSDLSIRTEEIKCVAGQLRRVLRTFKQVMTCLGLSENSIVTVHEVELLLNAVPELFGLDAYHGAWSDATLRQRLRESVDPVILDLDEASEIRLGLDARLSHRAFQPAARDLLQQSIKFEAWWSRLFGGFSGFRSKVIDFYKGELPHTRQLLSDTQLLRSYHERISEVERVSAELEEALLPGHVAEDSKSWKRTQEALASFEAYLTKAPQCASSVVPLPVHLKREQLQLSASELSKDWAAFQEMVSGLPELELFSPNATLQSGLQELERRLLATEACGAAIKSATNRYTDGPPSFEQILVDLITAQNCQSHVRSVNELFECYRAYLPPNANALDRELWREALLGIDIASKLTKAFGSSPKLREVTCAPNGVDAGELASLAEQTAATFQSVNQTWKECVDFVELSPPSRSVVDVKHRTLSDLKSCAVEAEAELHTIGDHLAKLVAVLRPGMSVPLARLGADLHIINGIRNYQARVEKSNSKLLAFGISHPVQLTEEDFAAAKWIDQASNRLLQSPLVIAVATDPKKREQVASVLQQVNTVISRTKAPRSYFESIFGSSQEVSRGVIPLTLALGEFAGFLRMLVGETNSVEAWIACARWQREMEKAGLATAIDELQHGLYDAAVATDAVCSRFYQQLSDYYTANSPQLDGFDGAWHEQLRESFRQLDEWEVKAAATQVREFQLGRVDRPRIGWMTPITSELGVLKRETEKKRRHMPLRRLFNEVPNVLQKLKPCIMMSPLSVSTFLQTELISFDMVIFDEASQVFPWDAIGAIYRGKQLIVAGDEKQLPPTNFFTRAETESDDEGDDIGDFESILSVCKSVNMPVKRLRWHYRSRREPLIAFSNKHFYDGDLVTFPSARDAAQDAVRLEFVADGRWIDRKNLPEARRIAKMVVEHQRTRPNKSLGVIAFNATQQQAIEDAIYELRRADPTIDALFDTGMRESLFVKNLETVQGDERDFIFLSFAYGPNEAGKFLKNFGPLSKGGGERRLNVAVTRAREEVVLIASVKAADMDLSGSTSTGAHLLKAYLEFAERGVDVLGMAISETTEQCESPFEAEVAAALMRHGLEPVPQVGCGGFRIDLALTHPEHPGVYSLGIECDGANYHSSRTARDRDRIRQSILEDLGWQICRIWSTDWVRNPNAQIQRILTAFEEALAVPFNSDRAVSEVDSHEFDDLQPEYQDRAVPTVRTYLNIDEVPENEIAEASLRILTRTGTVDWSDLIVHMARELGFARTGRKIRERFEKTLHDQLTQAAIRLNGERISIAD